MSDLDIFYVILVIIPISLFLGIRAIYRNRHSIKSKGWATIAGWNLLLLLLLISSVFLLGETYCRFFVDTTDSFGLNKFTKRWQQRHYRFNNYHWRDNMDYEKQKDPARKRITFVGDSFTAGHGVKNVDDRFANIIRQQHPEWEVHVLAANGFETNDAWESIARCEEIGYETDVFVLIYNLNDICWLSSATTAIYDRIFSFEQELSFLEKESYLLNFLAFRWKAFHDPDIRNYYHFVRDSYTGKEWEKQQELLRQIRDYLAGRKIKLLVVTFPMLQQLEEYGFTGIHSQLAGFWSSHDVPHLDLLPVFQQHSNNDLVVNAYDAHPNETAHRLAAAAISDFLSRQY